MLKGSLLGMANKEVGDFPPAFFSLDSIASRHHYCNLLFIMILECCTFV